MALLPLSVCRDCVPSSQFSVKSPIEEFFVRPQKLRQMLENQNSETETKTAVKKDDFQVNLDVSQFAPEEIDVKVVGNTIIVEGKHEEKQDELGYISRHFVRRYVLPKAHDMKTAASTLSSDGVLTISARRAPQLPPITKKIPIIISSQQTEK